MSNIPKLKKQAAEFEQKRQFDKALATYLQILEQSDPKSDEADVALFNRVGDLMLRRGSVSEAVDYYEKAVDLYTEQGFFNNAIALCNKILRNAPGRHSIYHKLGRISAKKGFISDAKQNFLEYADRMRKAGQLDAAFRALTEFADLCPDQDDIRLMLAEQLVRDGRKGEAIQQLQRLYEKFQAEGRAADVRATVDRMKAIDPSAQPREAGHAGPAQDKGLVFLDPHDDDAWRARVQQSAPPGVAGVGIPTPSSTTAPAGLPLIDTDLPSPHGPLPGLEQRVSAAGAAGTAGSPTPIEPIPGIERAGYESGSMAAEVRQLEDLEPTSVGEGARSTDEGQGRRPASDPADPADVPAADLGSALDSLPLILPDDPTGLGLDLSPAMLSGDPVPLADHAAGAAAAPPEEAGSPGASYPDVELPVVRSAADMVDDSAAAEPPLLNFPGVGPLWGAMGGVSEAPDRLAELRTRIAVETGNLDLRRQLGEALIEQGERSAGLAELDAAMRGHEQAGELAQARTLADEIVRLEPDSVRHHQKRVEFAVRSGDKVRLVDAYLELADCLVRSGELTKARSVYGRVYELAPDDPRAQVAVETMHDLTGEHLRQPTPTWVAPPPTDAVEEGPRGGPAPSGPSSTGPEVRSDTSTPHAAPPAGRGDAPPRSALAPTRSGSAAPPERPTEPAVAPPRRAPEAPAADGSFVDLTAWLHDDHRPKSTRMVVEGVQEPPNGEAVGFEEMLERFKQGVAANVDDSDFQSHYDLGIAYRQMGLLDEAIGEFQKALRASGDRVRTYEALGQCFVDKQQYQIAVALLSRALADQSQSDDTLIGVLYLLGVAAEALKRWEEARAFYERVFAVDIQFRDVRDRLAAVEAVGARA